MATKKKMGRPPIIIDWTKAENLCKIHCTGEEIASVLGIDYDTLNTHIKKEYNLTFSEYFKKHSGSGRASLRRNQFKMAEKSATMAIWLGKQYLGQKDIKEEENKDVETSLNNIADAIRQRDIEKPTS